MKILLNIFKEMMVISNNLNNKLLASYTSTVDDPADSDDDSNPPLFEDFGDDLYSPFHENAPPASIETSGLPLAESLSQQSGLSFEQLESSSALSQQSVASEHPGLEPLPEPALPSASSSPPSQIMVSPTPSQASLPTQSQSSSQESLVSASSSSSLPTPPASVPFSQSLHDTVSTACRRSDLVEVRCERRPRKPSPPRNKHPTPDEKLEAFLLKGCGCKWNDGGECFKLFDRDHYIRRRDECNSLTRECLDMVVLGQIMAFVSLDDVVGPSHKHAPTPRQTTRASFFHAGKRICTSTFVVLHSLGKGSQVLT